MDLMNLVLAGIHYIMGSLGNPKFCFHTAGVTGSIPVPPTNQNNDLGRPLGRPFRLYAPLATQTARILRV